MKVTEQLLTKGKFHQDLFADTSWYHHDLPGWVCMQQDTPRWRMSIHGTIVELKSAEQLCGLFALMGKPIPVGWRFLKSLAVEGVAIIAAERKQQSIREGYTPEHDDSYEDGVLSNAGAAYAHDAYDYETKPPAMWPFAGTYWKPSPDPVRNLAKAGALIAAEIDRFKRKDGMK